MSQNGRKKESGKVRVVRITSGILMILLALCAIFGLVLVVGNLIGAKTAGGFRCFTVLSDSMEPGLTEGDLVIVGKKDADQIAEGDTIVFCPSGESDEYLIHQVTEKIDNYEGRGIVCFYTSGTNAKEGDGFLLDEERVVGTVELIFPKLGYIARFLMIRWYCVIIYIVLLFLMLRIPGFWLNYRGPETGVSEREECLTAEEKKRDDGLTAEEKKREERLTAEKKKREERPTAEEKKHVECPIAENKKTEQRLNAKDKKRKDFLAHKKIAYSLWITLAVILVAAVPMIYVTSKDAVKEELTKGEGLVCAESFALTSDGNRAEGRNIRAVNTGNRDAIVMAVLTNEISFEIYSEDGTREVTGAEIIFDYSGVTSIGDGEYSWNIENESGTAADEGDNEEVEAEMSNEIKHETESGIETNTGNETGNVIETKEENETENETETNEENETENMTETNVENETGSVTETNTENEIENMTETNTETEAETGESYITAVYQGENPDDPSDDIVFRIYLNAVITYTDLTAVRKDYTEGDLEARELFDVYRWTFDDASSTETEAYFYCNYIVTPGDHTGELIDRVELVSGADGATGFDYSLKFELESRQEITPVGYLFGTANRIKGLEWSMVAENICGYYDADGGRSNYIFWEMAQ